MIRHLKTPIGNVWGGEGPAPNGQLNILVGVNASGKSCVLRSLLMDYQREADEMHERQSVDFVSPNRFIVSGGPQSMTSTAEETAIGQMKNRSLTVDVAQEIEGINIYRDILPLSSGHKDILKRWVQDSNLGDMVIHEDPSRPGAPTPITIDGHPLEQQSTGVRSFLAILVALLNPFTKVLLIDEPELSIEPRLQKKLLHIIRQVTAGLPEGIETKRIYIATHSHLFLDRETPENNWIIEKVKKGGRVGVELKQVKEPAELEDIAFNLLGGSPSDLFFPSNIIVVEGKSDACFLEKALNLIAETDSVSAEGIKFHYAGGDSRLVNATVGIEEILKTSAHTPVYKERLCVVGDSSWKKKKEKEVRILLNAEQGDSRILRLPKNGIEYYYPPSILAGLFDDDTENINDRIGEFIEKVRASQRSGKPGCGILGTFKGTKVGLAKQVADSMNEDHVKEIDPGILATLRRAIKASYK